MKDAIMWKTLEMLRPFIIGFIVPMVVDWLKHGLSWLDASPTWVKQGVAVAIAALITVVANATGMQLPTDIAQWDSTAIEVFLSGLFGIFIKQQKQLKKARE